MKLTINQVNINPNQVSNNHGITQASRYLAQRVKAYCDPYVPFITGTLKNTAFCGDNFVRYGQPYAHFQYVGKVMVGVRSGSPWAKRGEPKRYTGRSLTYSGGGQRGANWDKRMMLQRGGDLRQDIATFLGGKAKG